LFQNEDRLARSAIGAVVRYQGRPYPARISSVPPIFDGATRTLTLRLEVSNTDLRLRPDMFVDVNVAEAFPPGITVPSDAVLDSGRRKTVFIDHGDGSFEARAVETGARVGDRVVLSHGVAAGERVVMAGNFLLDSESRLQAVAARAAPAARSVTLKDPACGMDVDPSQAGDRKSPYAGTIYYFCSASCKKKFDANPGAYTGEKNTDVVSQYDRKDH
jgi:YHS domain-containing protein